MKISIIIPTLNEETYILKTIENVISNSFYSPFQIIVVDSGSSDKTTEIIRKKNIKLLEFNQSSRGRSSPLNYGAKFATGEILLFLDADSLVPLNYDIYIEKALQNIDIAGGAFEFALDGKRWSFRLIELINRIRYRIRKRYYGDQGLFIRKECFEKAGGFPEAGLLESAHLCEKLIRTGKLILLNKKIETSPRRFEKCGIFQTFAFDVRIWFIDLLGFNVDKYSEHYWSKN